MQSGRRVDSPEEAVNLTMENVQLMAIAAGWVGAMALQTWGIIKFIINRIDSGDNALHKRISDMKDTSVQKVDYGRDMDRVHDEIRGVRDEVVRQGSSTNDRIDKLIMALKDRKDE